MTVTEAFDEKNCLAETQYGTGTLETQLLCFEGENNKEHAIGFAPSSTLKPVPVYVESDDSSDTPAVPVAPPGCPL